MRPSDPDPLADEHHQRPLRDGARPLRRGRGTARRIATAAAALLAGVAIALGPGRWALSTGLPFFVVKQGCSPLRWSALLCPGLQVHSDYRPLPPVEGHDAWVYDPCAASIDDLLSDTTWIRMDITATWWQPRPAVDLPFLGSEHQRPLGGAPTGAQTAAWGAPGEGFAVAFAGNYFGPVCGKRDPQHYEVVIEPTLEEWKAKFAHPTGDPAGPTPP